MSCRKIIRFKENRIIYCEQPTGKGEDLCAIHADVARARAGTDTEFMVAYNKMLDLEAKLLKRT